MAQPNFFQRGAGRFGERFLAGSNNYNPRTNQYRNVVPGILGTAAKFAISAFGGPLLGRAASPAIDRLVNKFGPDPNFAQMVTFPIERTPLSVERAVGPPSPMIIKNLGFGAQRPGGNWFGYTGGAGSTGSFGNNQIGNGMASVGQWSPQSVWGQSIAADPGSNINFGNYSPGATATGAVRGGSGARSASSGGRIVGGNSVGDSGGARSAFWRRAYQQD